MQARSTKPEPGSGTIPLAAGARRQRVLFVDDEAPILEGLGAVLRPHRHEWDMVFALGGPAGLAEVEGSKFDVVVSDMRMPIIDGVALLTRVRQLQPHAVRLVLSGQTDPQTTLRSVFTAHQFLAKPCDPEQLRSVVKRCCELNEMLAADELKSLAGDVSLLPGAPTTYLAISKALGNPSSSISDVARIVERDPTLCAKVLQVANSAFFGLPRAVSSISQAANYLGSLALRDLALAMETMAALPSGRRGLPAARYRAFQLNALAVGLLGRRWFESERRKADDAFVAGMLRDLGHLVLATRPQLDATQAAQHPTLSACIGGELNQVVLNLVVNASHAIADVVGDSGRKGKISISTVSDETHAVIRVQDTGTGIPEHARAKVFEPFFTTKEVGKGTGQGLAMAYNCVVRRHKGSIDFETELGVGTTFVIRLPLSADLGRSGVSP